MGTSVLSSPWRFRWTQTENNVAANHLDEFSLMLCNSCLVRHGDPTNAAEEDTGGRKAQEKYNGRQTDKLRKKAAARKSSGTIEAQNSNNRKSQTSHIRPVRAFSPQPILI